MPKILKKNQRPVGFLCACEHCKCEWEVETGDPWKCSWAPDSKCWIYAVPCPSCYRIANRDLEGKEL